MTQIECLPLTEEYLSDIASIHCKALKNDLLPSLGHRFLHKVYYATLLNNSSFKTVVAFYDKKPVGFVQVCINRDSCKYIPLLLKKAPLGFSRALLRLVIHNPYRMIEGFLVTRYVPEVPDESSEITFIAVTPDYQGKGIGKLLARQTYGLVKGLGSRVCITKTLKKNYHIVKMYQILFNARIVDEFKILNKEYVYLAWDINHRSNSQSSASG